MVRTATAADAADIGRLLHGFNTEFGEPSPGAAKLAERTAALLAHGDTVVLLAGDGPEAVLVLRLRPALWSDGLEAYVEELYVVPAARRRGHGLALMDEALARARAAGARYVGLATGDDDLAAHALYERLGFVRDVFYGRDL